MLGLLRAGLVLAALMALAGLAAWIADQPGRIRISWFDHVIEAPAPLFALALLLLLLAAFIVTWLLAWAAALPQRRRLKRQARGYAHFAAGMVAVAAGESGRAVALAAKARGQLDDPALSRLLLAHAAQLDGDARAAQLAYQDLSTDPATAFLGHRGLLAEARRRGDREAALVHAQRASRLRPGSPFAAEAELQLLVEAGDWAGARARLDLAKRKKAVSREAAQQLAARLDIAEAQQALAEGNRKRARQLAQQAAKILPAHPAPPLLLARAADDHTTRAAAAQALRRAFARHPAEAFATAWLALQGDAAPERLAAAADDFVAERRPETASRLLLAAAALQARDFAGARRLLGEAGPGGGAWAARLQAQLSELGDGDALAADRWRALAGDAALWQCGHCGAGAGDWSVLCGTCGSFDALDPTRHGEAAALAAAPRPLLGAPRPSAT